MHRPITITLKTILQLPYLKTFHIAAATSLLAAYDMIVRVIMTNVDTLRYSHCIYMTVALSDQAVLSCTGTWLFWALIPSLACQSHFWLLKSGPTLQVLPLSTWILVSHGCCPSSSSSGVKVRSYNKRISWFAANKIQILVRK